MIKKLASLLILLSQQILAGYQNYQVDYKVWDPGKGGFDGSACWKEVNDTISFSSRLKQRESRKELAFSLISADSSFIQNIIQGSDTISDTLHIGKGLSNLLEVIKTEFDAIGLERKSLSRATAENEYKIITRDGPVKVKTKHTYSLKGRLGILRIEAEKGFLVKDLLKYLYIYPALSTLSTPSNVNHVAARIGGVFDINFIGEKRAIEFVYEGLKTLKEYQKDF